MRRCRGRKHKLFGVEADTGKGGADRDWNYGCKLMLAVTPEGVITGFLLSPASTGDHWAAEAFFCRRADPLGALITPEEMPRRRNGKPHAGVNGPQWPRYGPGAPLLPGRQRILGLKLTAPVGRRLRGGGAGAPELLRGYGGMLAQQTPQPVAGDRERQRGLDWVFHPWFTRARSLDGLLGRIAAKVSALNLVIRLNRHFGRPDMAFATLFSC